MRRRATAAVAFACAAIIAACGAFDSADAPAPTASEEGGVDSGTDASAADAAPDSSTPDASTDAHTFFDDFDDGPLGAKWTFTTIGAPAVLELSTQKVFSGKNALHGYFPDNDGGFWSASLMKRIDRSTKSFKCRTMLYVDDHSETATPTILHVDYRVPADASITTSGIDINIKGAATGTMIFQEPGGPSYPGSSLGLTTKKWMELALAIDSDTRSIAITVDGTPYITSSFAAPVRPNVGFEVSIGTFFIGSGDSASIFFDDFWCDVVFDP